MNVVVIKVVVEIVYLSVAMTLRLQNNEFIQWALTDSRDSLTCQSDCFPQLHRGDT